MINAIDELLIILESDEFGTIFDNYDAPLVKISELKRSDPVVKLTLLAKNSGKACDILLQQLGQYIDFQIEEPELDLQISALLLVMCKADPVMADFSSINVLRHPTLRLATVIARSHLLHRESAHDRLRKSA